MSLSLSLSLGLIDSYVCEEAVEEVGVQYCGVNATDRQVEEEGNERALVLVSNATVHPRAMMIHFKNTP